MDMNIVRRLTRIQIVLEPNGEYLWAGGFPMGWLASHRPTPETVRHAESLGMRLGDVRQLTGTIFASMGDVNGIDYWELAR